MINNKYRLLFTMFLLVGSSVVFPSISQLHAQQNEKIADVYFQNKLYCESIPFYDLHLSKYSDRNALMKRGKAHFHCGQFKNAVADFENAQLLGYSRSDANYYLAKTHHLRGNYETAIGFYKKYLAQIYSNYRVRKLISDEIKRCASGINMQYKAVENDIENLGSEINTSDAEIKIIQSLSVENKYYFTRSGVKGDKKSGILSFLVLENGIGEPVYINENHIYHNEMLIAISEDAQKIYFEREDPGSEKFSLLEATFSAESGPFTKIEPFVSPVSTENGDRDLFVINDSTYLFSSKRYPGFGGYDIFVTGIRQGNWFYPVNLGPSVNSPYDEISPGMTPDGVRIFFSSNRPESVGGYDVFVSVYNTSYYDWSIPENLGIPLNSPGDEIHFTLMYDGISGFLSSDRQTDGFGSFDLYRVYFKKAFFELPAEILEPATELAFIDLNDLKPISIPIKPKDQAVDESVPSFLTDEFEPPSDPIVEIPVKPDSSGKDFNFEEKIILYSDEEIKSGFSRTEDRITLKPLYYSEGIEATENRVNLDILASLVDVMKKYPQSSVLFTVHSSKSSLPVIDLLFTLNATAGLESYLGNNGISMERIRILSAGSALPLARSDVSERLRSASRRFNNRIDIQLFDVPDESGVFVEKPFVVNHIKDETWEVYQSIAQGLSYKILYSMTNDTPEKLNYLSQIQDCTIEKSPAGNSFRIFSGFYNKYELAREAKTILEEETGIHLAIIPFINNQEIPDTQLKEAAKKYRDLENYISTLRQ